MKTLPPAQKGIINMRMTMRAAQRWVVFMMTRPMTFLALNEKWRN